MRLRRLALAVLVLGSLAAFGAVGAPPATADPEVLPVDVVLEQLTPAVPRSGATLRLRGVLVNRAESTQRSVSVQLQVGAAPLDGIDEAEAASTAPVANSATQVAEMLAPGQSVPFEIATPIDALPLAAAGAYPLAVEVTALGADGSTSSAGRLVTVLPWWPEPADALSLAWLWPLAAQPNRDADGVFLNDRTAMELAPGGRLDTIVAAGAGRQVSWVVDPELLQAAAVIASGYQVLNGERVTIGQQSAAGQAWLSRLRRVTMRSPMRVVPYADIDAAAARRAGLDIDVVRAVTQAPAVADIALAGSRRTGPPVYWAPFGKLDQDTANLLASAGTDLVVLRSKGPAYPLAAFGTSIGSLTAVVADQTLSDIASAPAPTAQDVLLARQRFLARTLELAQSMPAAVMAPASMGWDPSPALLDALLRSAQQADWITLVPIDDLLSTAAPLPRQRAGYGSAARSAELPSAYMRKVSALNASVSSLGAILDDPAPIVAPFAEATLRAQSAAWRTAPKAADELLGLIRAEVAQTSGQVSVLTSGTITFSGDTGTVPIGVRNGLDQPVTVSLVMRGQPAPRLLASPSKRVTIPPGKTASIEISVRVVGSGAIPATVQLLTPQGSDFGAPAPLTVTSTAYSRAASWVVGAAFVAIAVFVVVGVTRRIHKVRVARRAPKI